MGKKKTCKGRKSAQHDEEAETKMADRGADLKAKSHMDGGESSGAKKDVGASNVGDGDGDTHNVPHAEKQAGIKPYVEVKLPDGRLVRQCRASESCPLSEGFVEKRVRMQDHLLRKHGLRVVIPKRQVGRRSNEEISARPRRCFSHPDAAQWKKQSEKRSMDDSKKFERNRREYKRLQQLLAEEAYNDLCDEFKTTTKEEFIAAWVEERMENYMSTSVHRLDKIRERIIARAKKQQFDIKNMPAWLQVVMDGLDDEEGHKPESSMNRNKQPSDGSNDDSDGDPSGHANDAHNEDGVDQHEAENVMGDEGVDQQLFEHMIDEHGDANADVDEHRHEDAKHKDTKQETSKNKKKIPAVQSTRVLRSGTSAMPINISSPTAVEKGSTTGLKYTIHNFHISIQQTGNNKLDTLTKCPPWTRLDFGVELEFVGTRCGISVNVSKTLVLNILAGEASTETMNLFALWMENIMPLNIRDRVLFVDSVWSSLEATTRNCFLARWISRVAIAKPALCFLPVLYGRHWSLFALSIKSNNKVLNLEGSKHHLLYFDSLGLTDPKDCLESIYGALNAFAPYVSNSSIRAAFLNPSELLELKSVEVPQQPNGSDCGFFVMAFMRYLIGGVLEQNMGKNMLTKDWFEHKDVCALRMDLHKWCHRVLETKFWVQH